MANKRNEQIQAEARDMAEAFEKGEPFYAKPVHMEPRPDQTEDDRYWENLAEIIHKVTPELAAIAFQGKGALYGPARAQFLLALWEKVHDRLHSLPEAQQTINIVPLPKATETPTEWRNRISEERKQLSSPSPSLDPKANS